jgi:hypothetical protein
VSRKMSDCPRLHHREVAPFESSLSPFIPKARVFSSGSRACPEASESVEWGSPDPLAQAGEILRSV